MKKILSIAALAALMLTIAGCNGTRKKALLPTISGKAGEVIVVINKAEWDGLTGNTLRETLASDCPFLPQPEPLYTLINISPSNFTNLFQVHRNIIIIHTGNDVVEPGVIIKHDVWAQPQCVIRINAIDAESANQLFTDNQSLILNTLEQAERDRIINNSKKYEERGIFPVVSGLVGGSPHFPSGYSIKKLTDDFIWVAYETTYTNQGFFIYKYPVSGEDDFDVEKMVAKRNEVLKNNVPGQFKNTYMTTSPITLPSIEYIKYKGRDFAQMRGYWEVHNDFMGGPFVSHTFYSPDGAYLINIEGFVYAPKYDKRHYLRQAESILYSFEWDEEGTKE